MSLWASTTAPKVPLESAGGDEAECVRSRLRERVSSPCGDDGEVEPAYHPPGGGGCAALLISSGCMEFVFHGTVRGDYPEKICFEKTCST